MKPNRVLCIDLCAVVTLIAVRAWAADPQGAPTTIAVQGNLTASGGGPAAVGNYTFSFSIHNAPAAGSKIWPAIGTEDHVVAIGADGLWSVYLGTYTPITVGMTDDTARWLEITLTPPGGGAETLGRVKLASTPFALEAGQLNARTGLEYVSQAGDTLAGDLVFDGDSDGIIDAKFDDVPTFDELNIFLYSAGVVAVRLYGAGYGELDLYSTLDEQTVQLAAGLYGYLRLRKDDASSGVALYAGQSTEGATAALYDEGGLATISFDADQTGNSAAVLPVGAISALEEHDEPGVASRTDNTEEDLIVGFTQSLLSRSITAPAAGYVLVIGTLQVQVDHTNPTPSRAQFGVSDSLGYLPLNQDVALQIDGSTPSGRFYLPVTVHGLFAVDAGSTGFYVLGNEITGEFMAADVQLSLVYFPTAYGTVTSTRAPGLSVPPGLPAGDRAGASTADIAAEQAEALAFNAERVRRELAAMQAELHTVTERLRKLEDAGRRSELEN